MILAQIAIVGVGSVVCYFVIDMTFNSLSFNSFAWETLTDINSKIQASEESIRDMHTTFESMKSYRPPNSYSFCQNIHSDTRSLMNKLDQAESSSKNLQKELKSIKSDMNDLKTLLEKSLNNNKYS